ncbi:MAG TPA: PepSY-like domain-containing protein [Bacteroidales bacterium]|nr:PepSY-like domain-containing protein [Bacteroidales bacterium]
MRNLIIVAILASGLSMCATAQKKAPDQVLKAFNGKYTSASAVKWDHESANEWEAEFKMNGKEMSAAYDNSGKWLETETEISARDLPSSVTETLAREYPGYKKGEIAIVENPEMKGFEIVLKKGESAVEVVVDSNGKILKKEQLNSEKDEDND